MRTTHTNRTSLTTRLLAALATLALLGACADGNGDGEPEEDFEIGLEETDGEAPGDDELPEPGELAEPGDPGATPPDDGEAGLIEDAEGVLLAVQPACVEEGDGFELEAEGVEPESEFIVAFDEEPTTTGEWDPAVSAISTAEGTLEVNATVPEDAGVQTGDYELELHTAATDGTADEWLISVDLEIADECAI